MLLNVHGSIICKSPNIPPPDGWTMVDLHNQVFHRTGIKDGSNAACTNMTDSPRTEKATHRIQKHTLNQLRRAVTFGSVQLTPGDEGVSWADENVHSLSWVDSCWLHKNSSKWCSGFMHSIICMLCFKKKVKKLLTLCWCLFKSTFLLFYLSITLNVY